MSGRTALIVEVPEAESAVGAHRAALDGSAALGVPAHITVLVPFVELSIVGAALLAELHELFEPMNAFDFALTCTGWFGESVVWLGPEDSEQFRTLTDRVFAAYPAYPPYEGAFGDVVPHLRIGEGHPRDQLRDAERAVAALLPIRARARSITLIAQPDAASAWTEVSRFPLARQ